MSLCLSREYLTPLNDHLYLDGRDIISQLPHFKSGQPGLPVSKLSQVPVESRRVGVSREMTVRISVDPYALVDHPPARRLSK